MHVAENYWFNWFFGLWTLRRRFDVRTMLRVFELNVKNIAFAKQKNSSNEKGFLWRTMYVDEKYSLQVYFSAKPNSYIQYFKNLRTVTLWGPGASFCVDRHLFWNSEKSMTQLVNLLSPTVGFSFWFCVHSKDSQYHWMKKFRIKKYKATQYDCNWAINSHRLKIHFCCSLVSLVPALVPNLMELS